VLLLLRGVDAAEPGAQGLLDEAPRAVLLFHAVPHRNLGTPNTTLQDTQE
jgi:hypothetical protein